MSKTTETQIEKSRDLIMGLRKHMSEQGEQGFSKKGIDDMETLLRQLSEVNADVDRLRDELAPKVKHMNELLAQAKVFYANQKKLLKGLYPQERWADYGIPDKR